MADVITDLVKSICTQAQRPDAGDQAIARDIVREVIDDINLRMNNYVLKSHEDFTYSAGLTNHTKEMPADYAKMIEFGRYDSTDDMIDIKWLGRNLQWFHATYGGSDLEMMTYDSLSVRYYFPIEDSAKRLRQIRVYPAFNESCPARAYYYAMLSEKNLNRLPSLGGIKDGVRSRLPEWFGAKEMGSTGSRDSERRYENWIMEMRGRQPDVTPHFSPRLAPDVQRRNAILRSL